MPQAIHKTRQIEETYIQYKCEFCDRTFGSQDWCIQHEAREHAPTTEHRGSFIRLRSPVDAERYAARCYARPHIRSGATFPAWYHIEEDDSGDTTYIYFTPIQSAIKDWEEEIEDRQNLIQRAKELPDG